MAFRNILIANRGEIACRIIRTARALGYRTAAVFSDADAHAPHVRLADQAVRIGPAPPRESYLDIGAVLSAARLAGADAVHPGYGFLAENPDFAEACARSGLVFIGPTPVAIRAMGNKITAKRVMIEAGVPCVPGYHGEDQSDEKLTLQARQIGLPVMVRAAAGGGGRGMRLVRDPADLPAALAGCRSEAINAFGSGELLIEKAIDGARHIEIQVFADQHGNVIHLGERDCSIQRRHQKVVEEAPSPAVSPELRAAMGEAAVAAARAIGYCGAGTIEFLLDRSGQFHFLEMNTRLQVEHPVTEAITGLDLVAWQLQVAAGELLPLAQHEVRWHGHAIEARLYAEDPDAGFLPRSGRILHWRPASGEGVRIDHGLETGQEITPFYDPLLAKVVGSGKHREEARRRLMAALEDTIVLGIATNRGLLLSLADHPVFVAAEAGTGFLETEFCRNAPAKRASPSERMVAVAAVLLFQETAPSQRSMLANWSSTGAAVWPLRLAVDDRELLVAINPGGSERFGVAIGNTTIEIAVIARQSNELRFCIGGVQQCAQFGFAEGVLHLNLGRETAAFRETSLQPRAASRIHGGSELLAPMNGAVVAVLAAPGDQVRKGQRILVVEAMKMHHEIVAARDGVLERIHVKKGDQVATRQLLGELAEEIGCHGSDIGNRGGTIDT